jgi:hypothetical protein
MNLAFLRIHIIRNLPVRATSLHSWKSSYRPLNCSKLTERPPPLSRTFTASSRYNMKEAIVAKGPKVTIHDVPIPKPNADQILIKVIYSGSNPKDWKRPQIGEPHNSGDDIAGIVEAVGENVVEFKKGDRVAAFHEMMAPSGSFAEYALAWDYTTFHLPKKTSFEEVRYFAGSKSQLQGILS